MKQIFTIGLIMFWLSATAQAALFAIIDQTSLAAGNVDVGAESAPIVLTCTVHSTSDVEWSVSLNATSLTHTDGVTRIPDPNFRYWFLDDAPGLESPAFPVDASVPGVMTTVYKAAASEYVTAGAPLRLGFKIIVSPTQKAGTYSSDVALTLVNSL